MSIEGYKAFDDPYTYPGTTVLQNLLNIRDQSELDAFEIEISTLRAEERLPDGTFDPAHYCSIHHHLFQDIYAWAGNYQTVRIGKEDSVFCYPEHIQEQMDHLFLKLHSSGVFRMPDKEKFLSAITFFLSELNAIHPFREGNGRVQLTFLGLIGITSGHPIHFEKLNRKTFLSAMITSFSGNLHPLQNELSRLLQK